jgi:hypothetical protein
VGPSENEFIENASTVIVSTPSLLLKRIPEEGTIIS